MSSWEVGRRWMHVPGAVPICGGTMLPRGSDSASFWRAIGAELGFRETRTGARICLVRQIPLSALRWHPSRYPRSLGPCLRRSVPETAARLPSECQKSPLRSPDATKTSETLWPRPRRPPAACLSGDRLLQSWSSSCWLCFPCLCSFPASRCLCSSTFHPLYLNGGRWNPGSTHVSSSPWSWTVRRAWGFWRQVQGPCSACSDRL
ncbi:hypothetical protein IWX90DRAFT_421080 [Phyllosticta citrichinensis]|uniref:Uncharacterized protein n=1 Tax=Phyllosticta citrichinensis TaxID=1130410 RepID=A0ABR1Y6Z8_9PEZI